MLKITYCFWRSHSFEGMYHHLHGAAFVCYFARNASTHYHAVNAGWHVYFSRSPDSRLLKEGLLYKVNSGGPRPYKFVLFSDSLIYGTETMRAKLSRSIDSTGSEGRKYKTHRRIPCNEFLILDDVESSDAFLVIYRKWKSFMVVAASAEDKQVGENGQGRQGLRHYY